MDPQANHFFPQGVSTAEQQAAWLAEYKRRFDPVEAKREYQDMLENGGVTLEKLHQELDEIFANHDKAKAS